MAMTKEQKAVRRAVKKINDKTKADMLAIGTYHQEFDPAIERYATLRYQFDVLSTKWLEEGCQITEEYTNNAGAVNVRKTALYLALESLRKDLLMMENTFGLTPKGLKAINSKQVSAKKGSVLEEALLRLNET